MLRREELIRQLNERLLAEMPEYRPLAGQLSQGGSRRLLRSLMNLRPPGPLSPEFLALQDRLLSEELQERGVVDAAALADFPGRPGISLYRGDITCLKADAIVNAANSALLGCFHPCHGCVDNAIHSAAGLQLREECARLMQEQGEPEPAGRAKLTLGYNLPARYVLHTVGPIVHGEVTERDKEDLRACYRSCMELAARQGLRTVAFCCISTGEFHFPGEAAAEIAVRTTTDFLNKTTTLEKVIFDVFTESDEAIYRRILSTDRAAEARA